MRHLNRWAFLLVLFFANTLALADEPPLDGRLVGYPKETKVFLDGGGVAGSWIIYIVLAVVCAGFLFMNARRSYLD